MARAKMKPCEKLMARLALDLGVKFSIDARFKRLYPGHWQRSSGAWLWVIDDDGPGHSHREIGSCYTVKEILTAEKISFYWNGSSREVLPE